MMTWIICLLLYLFITADTQIIFPDDDLYASLITRKPATPIRFQEHTHVNTPPPLPPFHTGINPLSFSPSLIPAPHPPPSPHPPPASRPTHTSPPSHQASVHTPTHTIQSSSPGINPLSFSPSLIPSSHPPHTSPPSHQAPVHTPPHTLQSYTPSVLPSTCGTQTHTRVVGGTRSEPGEWPWLAALGKVISGVFFNGCGGSLISVRHVLSAQHCFHGVIKPDVVRLGEYDFKQSREVPHTQDFLIALKHSLRYNERTYENDIVLLVLDRDVVFTDYIQPICLPFNLRDEEFRGQSLVVVGWGKTDFNSDRFSDVPLHALVPVVDRHQCRRSYNQVRGKPGPPVDERHLCAGSTTKDSCSGDSGGPLQHLSLSDGRYYLVGIVSFGYECASADHPGVYTRVASFLDWIVENLN